MQSFADPDTEFGLERSGSAVSVDGHKLGSPTGQVVCLACWRVAGNVDEIDHAQDCPQSDVHSEWYQRTHSDSADRPPR